MEKELVCNSCNKTIQEGATIFKCPDCGKEDIIRCSHCKKLGVRYKCPNPDCGFSGPN